ncbi:hypothetical protein [Clostridium cibarium]|nr:hypothetical protein [Clostridium cibarium]
MFKKNIKEQLIIKQSRGIIRIAHINVYKEVVNIGKRRKNEKVLVNFK